MLIDQIIPDQEHWHARFSFLKMLSVERAESLIYEIGLNVDRQSYSDVARFARACLEVYLYSAFCKGLSDSPHFSSCWRHYRATGGVLSDETIQEQIDKGIRGDNSDLYLLYRGYQHMITSNTSIMLDSFFVNHFWPARDGSFDILPFTILKIVGRSAEPIDALSKAMPLGDENVKFVLHFYHNYYSKKSKIHSRFDDLHKQAVLNGPSEWEAVLQSFPADSKPGKHYFWLSDICNCFIFQMFISEKEILREHLGNDASEQFLNWMQIEADKRGDGKLLAESISYFWNSTENGSK